MHTLQLSDLFRTFAVPQPQASAFVMMVRVNGGEPATLDSFFEDNSDGIDAAERIAIEYSLFSAGRYLGGGGAAPEFTLEREPS